MLPIIAGQGHICEVFVSSEVPKSTSDVSTEVIPLETELFANHLCVLWDFDCVVRDFDVFVHFNWWKYIEVQSQAQQMAFTQSPLLSNNPKILTNWLIFTVQYGIYSVVLHIYMGT